MKPVGWVVDMRHYLDEETGDLPDRLPTPVLNLALFCGSIVAWVTRQPGTRKPSPMDGGPPPPERVGDTSSQAADLVCYLMNLADDLQQRLSQGAVDPEVLPV